MEEQFTYSEAMKELESILDSLETVQTDVDAMVGKVRRATELIDFCRRKLTQTDQEIQKIFEEMDADVQ